MTFPCIAVWALVLLLLPLHLLLWITESKSTRIQRMRKRGGNVEGDWCPLWVLTLHSKEVVHDLSTSGLTVRCRGLHSSRLHPRHP